MENEANITYAKAILEENNFDKEIALIDLRSRTEEQIRNGKPVRECLTVLMYVAIEVHHQLMLHRFGDALFPPKNLRSDKMTVRE